MATGLRRDRRSNPTDNRMIEMTHRQSSHSFVSHLLINTAHLTPPTSCHLTSFLTSSSLLLTSHSLLLHLILYTPSSSHTPISSPRILLHTTHIHLPRHLILFRSLLIASSPLPRHLTLSTLSSPRTPSSPAPPSSRPSPPASAPHSSSISTTRPPTA